MKRYGLRDDRFAQIENHLPGRPGHIGRNSEGGNRLFVEAVIWKFMSGAPCRDLPERFGDWKNTHRRFSRWSQDGVWENLFKVLADDPDNEYAMIDAPLSEPISIVQVRLKRGLRPSNKALTWRPFNKDTRYRRCAGKPACCGNSPIFNGP